MIFLLRSVMMRHTQKQQYRGTTTTLMSLPPKTERVIEVEFDATEKVQYAALENLARGFYTTFKASHASKLSKYFLVLSSKLTPMRIACAGGPYPIENYDADDDNDGDEDDEEDAATPPKKNKVIKPTKFSDFAFRSKLKTLIAELKRTREADSTAKSLVFSQFKSTLVWLQEELPKHGFQFRTLSGDMSMSKRARALNDFQNDPPTTIFLLSMRAGAVGINLTQANRVYIMEPSFNPALEQQAIGRVHRLGQKRHVEVIRLLMKDSVESRLVKVTEKKFAKADDEDKKDDDQDEEIEDRMPAAKPTGSQPAAFVGSVATDRTTVLTEEFDLLFGVDAANVDESAVPEAASTSFI